MSDVTNVPSPWVRSLELWDYPVRGEPLQHWRNEAVFAECLAVVVREVLDGRLPDAEPEVLRRLRDVDSLWLTGGGVCSPLTERLRAAGWRVEVADDPVFAAVRAGYERRRAQGRGVERCVDIGQTSIKIFDGRRTLRIARDFRRAPLRASIGAANFEEARSQTLDFVAESIVGGVGPVCVALPCEIAVGGQPTACTYCWDVPDPTWKAELAARGGLDLGALELVHDGALAAESAGDFVDRRSGTVLVLTIGFGVGAALVAAR